MLPLYVALSIPVELVFLAFHVTVWYFVMHQIAKKKSAFASAFYVLYSLKSFADVGMYMTVRTDVVTDGTDLRSNLKTRKFGIFLEKPETEYLKLPPRIGTRVPLKKPVKPTSQLTKTSYQRPFWAITKLSKKGRR